MIHFIFVFLVFLVNMIPGDMIRENVIESANILKQEGLYPVPLKINLNNVKWDNYTTAILYGKFLCADNSMSPTSFIPNKILTWNSNPLESLYEQVCNGITSVGSYARYWIGSEVFLRPLSVFLNVSEIRCILFFVSTVLLFMVCISLYKNISSIDAFVFLVVMSISGMYLNGMCLTYCWELLITLIAVLLEIEIFKDVEYIKEYETLFFILVGSVTMFFAWLSYPLVTLGIPLLVSVILKLKYKVNSGVMHSIINLITNSISWCIGYGITMEMKGLICKIAGIQSTAESRIGVLIGKQNLIERIQIVRSKMIGTSGFYNSNILTLLVFAILLILCYAFVKKKISFKFDIKEILQYVIVSLYPCVWHFIFANHSEIHGVATMLHVISMYGVIKVITSIFVQSDSNI